MHPQVEKNAFGWIQIEGVKYKHDVVIDPNGKIRKRNKKLSKAVYGTSHKISLSEAQDILHTGINSILIGSGMFDSVRLSDEAVGFFEMHDVDVVVLPTGKAIKVWNESKKQMVGLFHITC